MPDEFRIAEKRIEYLTLVIGLCAAAAAAWFWGWSSGGGLAVGVTLSWINFRWLKTGMATLAALASPHSGEAVPRVPVTVYIKFVGRFVLLLLVLYAILSRSLLPAGPVLLGIFAVVAAVLVEIVYELAQGTGGGMGG